MSLISPDTVSSVSEPALEPRSEDVLKLSCPECFGVLNLLRKHIGIKGKCVHCQFSVTAVEDSKGVVQLTNPDAGYPVEPASIVNEIPVEAPEWTIPPEAVASISPAAEPMKAEYPPAAESFQSSPHKSEEGPAEPMPEPFQEEKPIVSPVTDPSVSWGFPGRGEPAEKEVLTNVSTEAPVQPKREGVESAPDGFSMPEEVSPGADDVSAEPIADDAQQFTSPLLAPTAGPTPVPAFQYDATEAVNSDAGSGDDVPAETPAGMSPFLTGSEVGDSSFTEPSFDEGVGNISASPEQKSPFSAMGPSTGSPLFAPVGTVPEKPVKQEEEEEVILDGDGRPMKPMTNEEKEQFGKEIMSFSGDHKRSKWSKRILRFFITIAVLAGVGYAAYVFMPQDQAAKLKDMVAKYLEPGSVLFDFIPVEMETIPEGEEGAGETRIKIKAIENLNQLTTEIDGYLDTAEENLNSTMSDGHKLSERERNEKMEVPSLPKMPFNLPGTGSASE